MSNLVAFAALWLLSSSATAQIVSTDCSLSNLYDWTYNSLNQSPCKVAAYLQSTCGGGSFTVDPLLSGESYYGPTITGGTDICKCNTVVYSLMSACGACQSAFWIDWPQWATNCTKVSAPGAFPNAIPQGTRVPQWALADVTREDLSLWDSIKAMDIGDTPEIAPGALIGASNTSSTGSGPTGASTKSSSNPTNFPAVTTPSPLSPSATSPSSQSSSSSSPAPSSSKKSSSSNTGAIVGGAVGGVALIGIAAIGVFFLRRPRPQAPSAAYMVDPAPQPLYESQNPFSDDGTHVSSPVTASETSTVPMRLYNPNDSTTFPGYQGVPSTPDLPVQSPFTQYTGNTMANMHTTHPQPQGYNGLPTV